MLLRSWTWRRPTAPRTESFSVLPTGPAQITLSLPSDTMTNTLARQQTTPASSHCCHAVQPMMSWELPQQRWEEVYQDSVKHWKQVWLVIIVIFYLSGLQQACIPGCFPSFSPLWGPCCPSSVNVSQVTQAMTNVTWPSGTGARSYITTLMSSRGHAKCHTLDTHCLMGCITCGTNYSVNLEAISSTGHKSECTYHGFSSSERKYSK